MNILLFDKTPTSSKHLQTALAEGGHNVTILADDKVACKTLQERAFEMLLVNTHGADTTALSMLQAAKEATNGQKVFKMIVANDVAEDYVVRLYDAGADAALRSPYGLALLKARLKAATRSAASTLHGVGAGGSPSSEDTSANDVIEVLARGAAWRNAPRSFQATTTKFMSLDVDVIELASVENASVHASKIMLSSAQHRLELRVALGADDASAQHLAVHLFGEEGKDLAPDMLSELANNLMGVLKAALGAESLAFTAGLPETLAPDELLRPKEAYRHQAAFALRILDSKVVIHLGVRVKANEFVSPAALREGMVSAKDVFNLRGLMLVGGGTRLSLNMIEKLRDMLPAKAQIEVMT